MLLAYLTLTNPGLPGERNRMNIKLYYHKTDGGAEYLFDTYVKWSHNGKSGKEGVINDKTKYRVRIDGDITKDAELSIAD